uniref:Uncharacterized protein n=1 Tax=Leersia perrieri TaxID=77586 RepID=A0A0D9V0C6_9ORYZ
MIHQTHRKKFLGSPIPPSFSSTTTQYRPGLTDRRLLQERRLVADMRVAAASGYESAPIPYMTGALAAQ